MLAPRMRGAITNYALCQIPLAQDVPDSYKVAAKVLQYRKCIRDHVRMEIPYLRRGLVRSALLQN